MTLFYTLEEAASLLGTSTVELRNRIQTKQVHALLIGGSWRLRTADVHRLINPGNSEVSVQAPESPAVRSEPGDKVLSDSASVPHASIPDSVPHTSAAESVSHDSAAEPLAEAFTPESLAEILIPESPPQPSTETSAGASAHAPPFGLSASSSFESLRDSLNRVLELARSQGILDGEHIEPGFGSHLPDEERTENLDKNGSDDEPDLSGTSRLEELFNLALASDRDEESQAGSSEGGSPTEPLLARALNLQESKDEPDRASPDAPLPRESKLAAATGKHPDTALIESRSRETTAPARGAVTPGELPKAKGSRTAQGGFFPVECPSCQALGQVPPNRMDQQLKCAECGTKFYLDLVTNETVIGEKVTPKVAEPLADKKPVDSKGIDAIDAMTNLSQKTRLRIAVMAFATAGLAFGLYYFWPRVGNTPGDRTAEILQALIHNSPGRVAAIAVPSSRRDVEAWFKKVRPKNWPEVLPEVPADINVISVKKQARASTSIDFPPSVAIMPGSQPEGPSGGGKGPAARSEFGKKSAGLRGLSLLLAWRYQNSQWLFDATESLKKTYPPK